jgi:hypothetical protein
MQLAASSWQLAVFYFSPQAFFFEQIEKLYAVMPQREAFGSHHDKNFTRR